MASVGPLGEYLKHVTCESYYLCSALIINNVRDTFTCDALFSATTNRATVITVLLENSALHSLVHSSPHQVR